MLQLLSGCPHIAAADLVSGAGHVDEARAVTAGILPLGQLQLAPLLQGARRRQVRCPVAVHHRADLRLECPLPVGARPVAVCMNTATSWTLTMYLVVDPQNSGWK
jgi:hypothetical protein